ncbi:MAG: DNA-directed DNA polymerase [Parcubacteria group bacterium GW2011_GWD2_38_12]|nr:MAG: DNA-directed DNA polymerase [Parcubacteria group bacterium GW2011_GWC2_36_17]KKQ39237.1 MAG: DNA-directed DNA polymerase [Candidatus Moranbacteria bacterium GW2011_GWF2_37_7]KKQ43901.1 MAG: DNA-directed DNA polymerase [Parcubacteria group bacterium GW2011_GWE2_37_8]KKQ52830.1 MAG: DNA-directed DNA polymerase [Parcubacteria group bacterium GW2011_GWD2_38_12]KKQ59034.1 MAG: DNA-directed DNA polymerase [Parcubacteria group bacterium GW2011_GWC1_38_17]KKQ59649.1 MAG: DNA-directed DNA polym
MPIVGHKKQINYLNNILKNKEQMPHAFLFVGPDKIGKKTIALEFIRSIQCEKSEGLGKHCNECMACDQQDRVSADFLLIEPDRTEKGDLKEIGISKIRSLIDFAGDRPVSNPFKIAIIDEAHNMTQEAQNALLKVLEEPKGDKVIFLVSSRVENFLDTILSRVYSIKFNFASDEEISKVLDAMPLKYIQNLKDILGIAGLRPGLVYDLSQKEELIKKYGKIIDDFFDFAKADLNDRFNYIEKCNQLKDFDIRKLLDSWIMILRFALFQKSQIYDLIDDSKMKKRLAEYSEKRTIKNISGSLCLAQEIYFLGKSTNINQRLAFEMLALAL